MPAHIYGVDTNMGSDIDCNMDSYIDLYPHTHTCAAWTPHRFVPTQFCNMDGYIDLRSHTDMEHEPQPGPGLLHRLMLTRKDGA